MLDAYVRILARMSGDRRALTAIALASAVWRWRFQVRRLSRMSPRYFDSFFQGMTSWLVRVDVAR